MYTAVYYAVVVVRRCVVCFFFPNKHRLALLLLSLFLVVVPAKTLLNTGKLEDVLPLAFFSYSRSHFRV